MFGVDNPWLDHDRHFPQYFSEVSTEENPLLANRLVQLGLHEWARGTLAAKRNQLREWKFKMDYRAMDSTASTPNALHDSEGQLDGKSPFLHWTRGDPPEWFRGRDAAILEACAPSDKSFWEEMRDESKPNYMPSGYFPVDAPGVFFNELRMIVGDPEPAPGFYPWAYDRSPEPTPVWGLHHNLWPAAFGDYPTTLPLKRAPLISNSGTATREELVYDGQPAVEDPNISCNHPTWRAYYDSALGVSLDGLAGSSGGIALVPSAGETGIRPYLLDGVGIISLANDPDPDCTLDSWCTTLNNAESASADTYIALSLNNQDIVDWSLRGDPGPRGTVAEPSPEQRGKEWPECKGLEDPAYPGGCFIFTSLPPGGSNPNVRIVFIDEVELEKDSDHPPPTEEDIVFVCDRPGLANNAETHAGVAIGLLGASTTPSEQEESAIGSLALVCAPWSSYPYTSNWRFVTYLGELLSHEGGASPDTFVSKFSRSYGLLSRGLGYMFERRCISPTCGTTLLRPPSMQLCPPNYVMEGVNFIVHNKQFVGVSALRCVSTDKNGKRVEKRVPLNPDTLYSGQFGDYEVAGEAFSLEQHIGRANLMTGDDSLSVSCPTGTVLGGLRVKRNPKRTIVGVEPSCTTMPKVRMDMEVP